MTRPFSRPFGGASHSSAPAQSTCAAVARIPRAASAWAKGPFEGRDPQPRSQRSDPRDPGDARLPRALPVRADRGHGQPGALLGTRGRPGRGGAALCRDQSGIREPVPDRVHAPRPRHLGARSSRRLHRCRHRVRRRRRSRSDRHRRLRPLLRSQLRGERRGGAPRGGARRLPAPRALPLVRRPRWQPAASETTSTFAGARGPRPTSHNGKRRAGHGPTRSPRKLAPFAAPRLA